MFDFLRELHENAKPRWVYLHFRHSSLRSYPNRIQAPLGLSPPPSPHPATSHPFLPLHVIGSHQRCRLFCDCGESSTANVTVRTITATQCFAVFRGKIKQTYKTYKPVGKLARALLSCKRPTKIIGSFH